MQLKIEVKNGKITSDTQQVKDIFSLLDNGTYILSLERVGFSSVTDYRKAYFDRVQACSLSTGNDKYTIHEAFKSFMNVNTTKEFNESDWKMFLNKFSWWAFDNLDCMV